MDWQHFISWLQVVIRYSVPKGAINLLGEVVSLRVILVPV